MPKNIEKSSPEHSLLDSYYGKSLRSKSDPPTTIWEVISVDGNKKTLNLMRNSEAFGTQNIIISAVELENWEIV